MKKLMTTFSAVFLMISQPLLLVSCNQVKGKNFDESKYIKIAHAGGSLDNVTYTNTMDALNYNYHQFKNSFEKKFYFEIDFLKTSDNYLVGVHDWNKWYRMSGWNKDRIPTHSEFMSQKIMVNGRECEPLDLERIMNFLELHQDAVLFTDKEPDATVFINTFNAHNISLNRLYCEMFDLENIKKAFLQNFKHIIATWNLVQLNIPVENAVNFMQTYSISYFTAHPPDEYKYQQRIGTLRNHGFKALIMNLSEDYNVFWKQINDGKQYMDGFYFDTWNYKI